MKEQYTLQLSRHQAKVLNSALHLASQVASLPPGPPLYNLPTEGIEVTLVKDEFALITNKVIRQLEEQDRR